MSLSESAKPQARFDFSRGGGIFIAFILLCAVLSFATPYFLTFDNLVLVARQSVFIMIVALAMTFVIAMGGSTFPSDPPWRPPACWWRRCWMAGSQPGSPCRPRSGSAC